MSDLCSFLFVNGKLEEKKRRQKKKKRKKNSCGVKVFQSVWVWDG